MAEKLLKQRIIERSISNNWEDAVKEWVVHKMYMGVETCTCGKKNINRVCIIRNSGTKRAVKVGSSCVHKFMYIPTQTVFNNIIKLQSDKLFLVKECTLQIALDSKAITQWDFDFYLSAYKFKRKSPKQEALLLKINHKLETLVGLSKVSIEEAT